MLVVLARLVLSLVLAARASTQRSVPGLPDHRPLGRLLLGRLLLREPGFPTRKLPVLYHDRFCSVGLVARSVLCAGLVLHRALLFERCAHVRAHAHTHAHDMHMYM